MYNELKIMLNLTNNENVIKINEFYENFNTYYFIMELVEGMTLQKYILSNLSQPQSSFEIKKIMHMLIQGVSYISSKNIIHRDIKLENLLLTNEDNILKIIDFGLSTFTSDIPYIFPKCGTPGYVAPEIANSIDKANV